MAVPPIDPTNTERWFYDYTAHGAQHSMLMRTADERSAAEAAEAIDTFLTAIEGNLTEITTVNLRVARAGSNITNDESTVGLQGTYGSGSGSDLDVPLQVTFPGRSADGHKNRVGMFGWNGQVDVSWRITSTEDADVLAGVGALNALSASGFFVTITGERSIYKQYANIGYNDHWVKEQRKSG